MRILFLTFYYSPDLCAGSFRNTAFANALANKLRQGDLVHIVSTTPNRYKTFAERTPLREEVNNLIIDRIQVPLHQSGFLDQIISFFTYFIRTLILVRKNKYDLVYGSSSRLFTAFLAAIISRWKSCPLYLDVRDLFVDTITEVIKNKFIVTVLKIVLKPIERFTFSSASHINMVSPGFEEYLQRFGVKNISFYTNGIDEEFLNENIVKGSPRQDSAAGTKRIILYAGNIGEGQGLEKIVPLVAKELQNNFEFWVVGDGGTKQRLKESIDFFKLKNVLLMPPVNRVELIKIYHKVDYLFLHLNDYEAFKKVLPSKIFEYAAFDKPIIAGVQGIARVFIKEHISNSILFDPGDAMQLSKLLMETPYITIARNDFRKNYSRSIIMGRMAESLLSVYV